MQTYVCNLTSTIISKTSKTYKKIVVERSMMTVCIIAHHFYTVVIQNTSIKQTLHLIISAPII